MLRRPKPAPKYNLVELPLPLRAPTGRYLKLYESLLAKRTALAKLVGRRQFFIPSSTKVRDEGIMRHVVIDEAAQQSLYVADLNFRAELVNKEVQALEAEVDQQRVVLTDICGHMKKECEDANLHIETTLPNGNPATPPPEFYAKFKEILKVEMAQSQFRQHEHERAWLHTQQELFITRQERHRQFMEPEVPMNPDLLALTERVKRLEAKNGRRAPGTKSGRGSVRKGGKPKGGPKPKPKGKRGKPKPKPPPKRGRNQPKRSTVKSRSSAKPNAHRRQS